VLPAAVLATPPPAHSRSQDAMSAKTAQRGTTSYERSRRARAVSAIGGKRPLDGSSPCTGLRW
jgi:hypothetical protein